jgi:hypothetical protein
MNSKWDERPDAFLRARLELIKALHRTSLLEPEEAKPAKTYATVARRNG